MIAAQRVIGKHMLTVTQLARKFEEMEPEQHQHFLESLGIDKEEIKQIRNL